MSNDTAKLITEMQGDIKELCKDQEEIKQTLRELKGIYPSVERFDFLERRFNTFEQSITKVPTLAEQVRTLVLRQDKADEEKSKLLWIIVGTIVTAVLSYVVIGR